ncbi:MAG: hypothetical protein ACRD18_06735 [Terriglobia bacterium]
MWHILLSVRRLLQRANLRVQMAPLVLLACLLGMPQLFSNTVTIDFEGFPDGTAITTQYLGLS